MLRCGDGATEDKWSSRVLSAALCERETMDAGCSDEAGPESCKKPHMWDAVFQMVIDLVKLRTITTIK